MAPGFGNTGGYLTPSSYIVLPQQGMKQAAGMVSEVRFDAIMTYQKKMEESAA